MIDTKQLIKAGEEKMTFAIEYLDEQLSHIRAGKQEDKDCDTEIENEQEEHHAKTVDDLWNGKVVIVVILNLCFDNIFPCFPLFV